MVIRNNKSAYSPGKGITNVSNLIVEDRNPSSTDMYPQFQDWFNSDTNSFWKLAAFTSSEGVVSATWVELGGGELDLESFIVSSGTSPVEPDVSNQITLTDGNGVGMTGGTNAITFDMVSPFSGNFTFTKSTAAEAEVLTISHTDDTAASDSSSNVSISVGGTTQIGDPYVSFVTGTSRSFAIGTDTSDSQILKVITAADETANPSTGTEVFSVTTSGAAKFADAFTFPTSDGSAGQVLSTDGAGNVGWESSASTTWTEVTATGPTALSVNEGVVANNGSQVNLTLPATAAVGDIIRIAGKGAGGFQIQQNAGQTIHFAGSSSTTGTGGSITSTIQYNAIELVCTTANTDFVVISSIGNFTVA